MKIKGGLRIIALFEAAKGLLVLLAGFGLLTIVHRDLQHIAEQIVSHFHLNPASHYPHIFVEMAGNITNRKLWLMAVFAMAYSGIRLLEAYGLWHERRWAEWLAVASGGLYVPIEIYEMLNGVSAIKAATLIINLGIVAYLGYVLYQSEANTKKLLRS